VLSIEFLATGDIQPNRFFIAELFTTLIPGWVGLARTEDFISLAPVGSYK
jgi:hypothetical protein